MAEIPVTQRKVQRKIRPIRIDGDVAYVPLTRGLEAVIDAADAHLVIDRNWSALVTEYGHAYATTSKRVGDEGREQLMHRHITGCAKGLEVDHIDGNGLNNRRANLRVCTHRENMANQMVFRNNRLGLKGVYAKKGKYYASIEIDRRTVHLGSFDTPAEAAAAYRGAAKLAHGHFSWQ